MKRMFQTIVLAVASSLAALAQYSTESAKCFDAARTQYAMNICAGEEADRADDKLNDVYQRLLAAAGSEDSAREKIQGMEKAWVVYRDAALTAKFPAENKQATYGTIYPTDFALFQASLTYRHIATLKEILER